MSEMILTTYDWVPEAPRGFVRDLRARWALEEAGLPYRVETTPFSDRGEGHFARQPFGQVPWIVDGDVTLFESGAIVLHIAGRSGWLLPEDPARRAEVSGWMFAALNSVEMAVLPCAILGFSQDAGDSPGAKALTGFLEARLAHMEAVLDGRDWLAGDFSAADILMADVLRLADGFGGAKHLAELPACSAYVARATERPAFRTAHADQIAHFAAAD